MKPSSLAALAILCAGSLSAAEEPEKSKEPARQVRFMAVGELPPFRQEVRDGVRHELEPPAGSIPPREVMVGFGDEAAASTPLRLGRISEPLKAPSGAGPMLLRRPGDAGDSEPWLRIARPEAGDFLVLLWRDPKQGSWAKAASLVLPDDAAAVPAGSLRIVNLSPVTVRIVIGGDKLILEAGKTIRRPLPPAKEQPFEVYLGESEGSLKRLYSSNVLQNPGERGIALIYQADGLSSRRPIKVSVQREPAPVAAVRK